MSGSGYATVSVIYPSNNSSSSSESENEQLNEVRKDFKITIPLFKIIGFTQPLVDKINRGIFRVKVDRNFVYFSGLKFFGLKPNGEGIPGAISVNRFHVSIYEGSQRTKLGEVNDLICQMTDQTTEIERRIENAVRLQPGIEYEIRYEYSGPKVRFGKERTSEHFTHYNRYVGTIGFSVQMIQGKNNRVAGLVFHVKGIPQIEPLPTGPYADHLITLFSNGQIDEMVQQTRDDPTFSSKYGPYCTTEELDSLKVKQNVEIHADYSMKETIEEYSKHSVELKFRCNKRIVIDGIFFNGWTLPSDVEHKRATFLIDHLEIVEAATEFGLASSSEKWNFQAPPELKIPLHFIDHTPIAPDVWHILKYEFSGPVMRYGTKPRSTISLDTGKGENVVWTFDLENSKNTETLHSLVYQFSEDQSKEAASPDQEC